MVQIPNLLLIFVTHIKKKKGEPLNRIYTQFKFSINKLGGGTLSVYIYIYIKKNKKTRAMASLPLPLFLGKKEKRSCHNQHIGQMAHNFSN